MHKSIIKEYYLLALKDIEEGISVSELEEILEMYEDAEAYEQCAGIKKAIDEVKHNTINNIKKSRNDY